MPFVRRRGAVRALALSCVLVPATARAQGLSVPTVGDALSGPATIDGAAVFHNPGALGFLEGGLFQGDLSLLGGEVGYTRERRALYQNEGSLVFTRPVPASSLDPSKTGKAPGVSANPFAAVPSGFIAAPLGRTGLVLGFGAYSPYAALAEYSATGAQKWQLQKATVANVFFTPALAYRPNDIVSFGIGASYVFGLAELSRIQDFAALPELGRALAGPPINQANEFGPEAPPAVRELSVMARPFALRKAFASGATFNVGTMIKPIPTVRIGLSYQHSTSLTYRGAFDLDMNDPFFTQDLASQGLKYNPVVRGDASLSFSLPKVINLGAAWDVTKALNLGLQGQFTFWSDVESFDVRVTSPDLAQPALGISDTSRILLPRRWQNTIGLDASARYAFSDSLAGFGTVGYRSPASPDATIDASSPDGHRFVVGAGVSVRVIDQVKFVFDAKAQVLVPRDVVTSDYDLGNGRYTLFLLQAGGHLFWTWQSGAKISAMPDRN